jgi:hypothetical protein
LRYGLVIRFKNNIVYWNFCKAIVFFLNKESYYDLFCFIFVMSSYSAGARWISISFHLVFVFIMGTCLPQSILCNRFKKKKNFKKHTYHILGFSVGVAIFELFGMLSSDKSGFWSRMVVLQNRHLFRIDWNTTFALVFCW